MRNTVAETFTLATISLSTLFGCNGSLPAIRPPKIDAAAAGKAAIEQYDADGDGLVKGKELEAAPSLRFALDRLDSNRDRAVSAEEVTQLIEEKWVLGGKGSGSIGVKAIVSMDGRKLAGATVTFEPEAFLGKNVIPSASGISDRNGLVSLTLAKEDRQHPNARFPAPGLYLVHISKEVGGNESIPAKYNSKTELGVEVARRASYAPGAVQFRLKSK